MEYYLRYLLYAAQLHGKVHREGLEQCKNDSRSLLRFWGIQNRRIRVLKILQSEM